MTGLLMTAGWWRPVPGVPLRAPWSRPGLSHQPLPAAERQTTVNIPVLAARAASYTRKAATAAFLCGVFYYSVKLLTTYL